jgi:hypothetical protein
MKNISNDGEKKNTYFVYKHNAIVPTFGSRESRSWK